MSSFPASHVSNTSLVSSPAGPLGNTRSEPVISEENGGPTESFFSPVQQQQVSPVSSDMDAVPASVVATRDKSKLSPGNNSTTDSLRHSYHLSELNYHTSLKERVGSLFDSLKFADVTFVIGEGEESVELVAHKLILAISSPVFAAMFYGSLKCEDRVIITDCRADAFRNMLQFAYKSELLVADTQLALDVLYAARKYSMRLLEDECMIYLCGHVTHESVLAVREAAEKYHFPILESICDEYIEQNSYQVLKFHYPFLPIDSLEQFISSDHLTIQEVDLFRILLDWAALECERQELEESPLTLRKVLNPLIHEIRFPLMSAAEMADSVVPTGVLTTEEVAAILTYISATDKHGVSQVLAFPTRGRVQKKPVILSSSPSNNSGGAAGSSGTGNQRAINQSLEDTTWIGRSPRKRMHNDEEPVDLHGIIAQVRRTFEQEMENRKEKLLFHMNNYSSVLDNLFKLQVLKHDEVSELDLISEVERKKEALVDIIVKKDFLDANLILESLRDGESPSLQWLMRIIIRTVLSKHPDFDARLIKKPPPDWSHSSASPSKPRKKLQSLTTTLKRLSGIVSTKTNSLIVVNLHSGEQSREPSLSRFSDLDDMDPLSEAIPTGAVKESDYEFRPPALPPKPKPTLPPRPDDYKHGQPGVDEVPAVDKHGYENPFAAHQGVVNGEPPLFNVTTEDISPAEPSSAGYQIPNLPRPAHLSDHSTGQPELEGKPRNFGQRRGSRPKVKISGNTTRQSPRKSFCCW